MCYTKLVIALRVIIGNIVGLITLGGDTEWKLEDLTSVYVHQH